MSFLKCFEKWCWFWENVQHNFWGYLEEEKTFHPILYKSYDWAAYKPRLITNLWLAPRGFYLDLYHPPCKLLTVTDPPHKIIRYAWCKPKNVSGLNSVPLVMPQSHNQMDKLTSPLVVTISLQNMTLHWNVSHYLSGSLGSHARTFMWVWWTRSRPGKACPAVWLLDRDACMR